MIYLDQSIISFYSSSFHLSTRISFVAWISTANPQQWTSSSWKCNFYLYSFFNLPFLLKRQKQRENLNFDTLFQAPICQAWSPNDVPLKERCVPMNLYLLTVSRKKKKTFPLWEQMSVTFSSWASIMTTDKTKPKYCVVASAKFGKPAVFQART